MNFAKAITVCCITLLLFSNYASATKGAVTSRVIRILTDDTRYGGCMAEMATSPSTVLAGCGTRFVTFDCLNTLGTTNKSNAQTRFASAQLAYVTGNDLYVKFDDSKTINGYCYAERADNR